MWPSYQSRSSTTRLVSFLRQSLLDRQLLVNLILLASMLAVYRLGVNSSFPFVDQGKVIASIQSEPILLLIDTLFTGMALRNAGIFSLGILSVIFIMDRRFRNGFHQFRGLIISRYNIFIVFALIVALIFWLRSIEAIPKSVLFYIVFGCYVLLGLVFLFKIETFLIRYFRTSLLNINALFIVFGYLINLLLHWSLFNIIPLVMLAVIAISMVWLQLRLSPIHLVNIRLSRISQGVLPVPASNTIIRLTLPLLILCVTALASRSLSVLFALQTHPYGASRTDNLILIIVSFIVLAACSSSKVIDAILSQFSVVKAAQNMKQGFWIIPGVDPDEATVEYLAIQMHKSMRINYYLFFFWIILLSILNIMNFELHLDLPALVLGVPGFLVAFVLSTDLICGIIRQINRRLQLVSVSEFWSSPSDSSLSAIPIESASLEEIFERYLPLKNDEERKSLQKFFLTRRPEDFLHFMVLIQNMRNVPDEVPITLLQVISKLGIVTILGLIIVALISVVMERISPGLLADSTQRAQLLAVWIGIQLSMIPLLGVDQDMRAYLRQRRRRQRP